MTSPASRLRRLTSLAGVSMAFGAFLAGVLLPLHVVLIEMVIDPICAIAFSTSDE